MEATKFDENDALVLGVGKQLIARRRAYYNSLIIAAVLGAPLTEHNFRRVLKANTATVKINGWSLSLTEAGEKRYDELIARLNETGNWDVVELLEVLNKIRLPDLKRLKDGLLGKPVKQTKKDKNSPFEIIVNGGDITFIEKDDGAQKA